MRRAIAGPAAAMGVVVTLLAERAHASIEPRLIWRVSGEGRGTPVLVGSAVYFLSKRHEVVAIDARSGVVRWRSQTGSPGDATAGALVLASGSTLVAADGDLVAFDLHTGVMRWRSGRNGDGTAFHLGDTRAGVVFAGSVNGTLHAIQADTGQERWQTAISTDQPTTIFAPVLARDDVVAAFVETNGERGGIITVDSSTGLERWRRTIESTRFGPAHPASKPVVFGGLVLLSVTDGSIRSWSLTDGTPRWAVSTGPQGVPPMPLRDFRPLVVVGQTLVAGSLTGWLVAYDLLTRRALWRVRPIDASVAFGLAADDEAVYVPYLSGDLVAVESRTGRERWRTSGLARGFSWTPLVREGHVYASASDDGYFAFHP